MSTTQKLMTKVGYKIKMSQSPSPGSGSIPKTDLIALTKNYIFAYFIYKQNNEYQKHRRAG